MENELENSIEFINKKAGSATGFSVPSNYFENLEEEINVNLVQDGFNKDIAFQVPGSYFNKLDETILKNISETEKERKVISLKNKVFKLIPYAAAACILLFVGLNSFVFNSNEQVSIDNISDIEIENWMDINDINTSEIAVILEDEIIEEYEFSFTEIKDESIEEYINSIDNSSLLNELNQ